MLIIAGGRANNGEDNGDFNQTMLAQSMAGVAEEQPIDFVINTGDNFYPNGLDNETDPQFVNSFSKVYTGESLQKPFYGCLGNHDYYKSSKAQVTNENENGLQLQRQDPRWVIPDRSYERELVDSNGNPIAHLFFVVRLICDIIWCETFAPSSVKDDFFISLAPRRIPNRGSQVLGRSLQITKQRS